MIAFIRMTVTCAGFMFSGVLLWEGALKVFGYLFIATWLWLAVPKIPTWIFKGIEKLFSRRKEQPRASV